MIKESGETMWQEEVLPAMRADFVKFLQDGSAAQTSVQDSVIVVSLSAITEKDADRIKILFLRWLA